MQGGVLVLVAADAQALHFLVGPDVVFREVLLEKEDVDSESEDAEPDDHEHDEEDRPHTLLMDEVRADGFVVVHLVDDGGEDLGHRHDADLGIVREFRMRDGVRDEDLLQGGIMDALHGAAGEQAVRGAGADAVGAKET